MNKKQLIESIKEKMSAEVSKSVVEDMLDSYMESVKCALQADDVVSLVGFGTFGTRIRSERTGRNPQTGESMVVPEAKVPYFKPGKNLKDLKN
tara:strand:- start:1441 stop:1719 length:279 start_codon:yes stop_codon:yes gene_type:complete